VPARQMRMAGEPVRHSTHDTKRTEDVARRGSMSSRDPATCRDAVFPLSGAGIVCTSFRRAGRPAPPHRSDEYLLYKTAVAPGPSSPSCRTGEVASPARIPSYMLSGRKAKVLHTSWVQPQATRTTRRSELCDEESSLRKTRNRFLMDFWRCIPPIPRVSACQPGLAQTLLKITAPAPRLLSEGPSLGFSLRGSG